MAEVAEVAEVSEVGVCLDEGIPGYCTSDFLTHHKTFHHELVQAWAQIYPDEMVACGYITKQDRDEI